MVGALSSASMRRMTGSSRATPRSAKYLIQPSTPIMSASSDLLPSISEMSDSGTKTSEQKGLHTAIMVEEPIEVLRA